MGLVLKTIGVGVFEIVITVPFQALLHQLFSVTETELNVPTKSFLTKDFLHRPAHTKQK